MTLDAFSAGEFSKWFAQGFLKCRWRHLPRGATPKMNARQDANRFQKMVAPHTVHF